MRLEKGTITPALLVIASAFIIAIYGLLFILTLQFDYSQRQISGEKALNIAEAGVNYYQWHLIKNPNDFQDGTSDPDGPYVHEYKDPQGEVVGNYSLDITAPTVANPYVTIRSTAWTDEHPKVKRTIEAQFGNVNLTAFAFVHNTNLWFGNDITINGPLFSNGGIRMDGTNTSTVQSAKETYICGTESGCKDPTEKPGVWGNGSDKDLWEFPVAPIDFDGITVNFNQMKEASQTEGLYLEPSGELGYHIIFSEDGTFNVYEVTGTDYIKAWSPEKGCENLYQVIVSEVLLGSYAVADIPIVFVEDTFWVEGTVKGDLTIGVAEFPLGSFTTYTYISSDLKYSVQDGTDNLGLISHDDIIFTRDVPDYFYLNGAFIAHQGRILRHHYGMTDCKSLGTDKIKNRFYFYGSMVSRDRSYWNFSSGPGIPASGFVKSELTFNPNAASDPPGHFPASQYQLVSWKEE